MGVVRLSNAGIRDFQKTDSALAGNTAFAPDDEDFLEEVVLTSDASSVTFTGLNNYSDYKHLQVRAVAKGSGTSESTSILRFNSDTTYTKYRGHLLASGASGGVVSSDPSQNSSRQGVQLNNLPHSNQTDQFAVMVVDILDPFDTSKNTTTRNLGGFSPDLVGLYSGVYMDTSAITSITFSKYAETGGYLAGSRFSLYGAK